MRHAQLALRQVHNGREAVGEQHREHEREVPRAEDQADPARFIADLRAIRRIERGRDFGGSHPRIEIVDIALDIGGDVHHFGDADLTLGLARVFENGGDDGIGMGLDRGLQPRQLGLARLGAGGLHVPLVRLLEFENAEEVGCGRVGHGLACACWGPQRPGLDARLP